MLYSVRNNILADILKEVERAETLHPNWPNDPIHGAAIVGEESGELIKAAIDFEYHSSPAADMETEAIQVAATAIRLLAHCRTNFREGTDA